jgi:hypothetical protein
MPQGTMTNAELYLRHLANVTGRSEDGILMAPSPDPDLPDVAVFVYEHWPKPGFITGFTFGLSVVSHPDWRFGRPELMIMMESNDKGWPFSAAYTAARFRGDCPFSYGNIINFRGRMSEESEFDAFIVFAPPHLDREQERVQLADYTCFITGLYPMHSSEFEIYERIGLEQFWKHPAWDPLNPHRLRIK